MRRFRQLLDGYGARVVIGEISDNDPTPRTLEYIKAGLLHTAYSFGFLMDEYGAGHFADMIREFQGAPAASWPSWAFSNHDVARVASRWSSGGDPAFAKLMLALLMCLRGTVFLYQGEELGLTEADVAFEHIKDPYGLAFWPEFKGRDGCRKPMPWEAQRQHLGFSTGPADPWLPIPPEHAAQAVDVQQNDAQSVLTFARDMIRLRRSSAPLRFGSYRLVDATGDRFAFVRERGGDAVLRAFNLGPDKLVIPVELATSSVLASWKAELQGLELTLGTHGFAVVRLRLDPETLA